MKATLNGIEIEYQDGGRGPAVLLGHGYSATGRMWDGQRAALGDRWRIISWDMRGHGQSESPADPKQYSAALTVADMRALLQHCGEPRAVIGGLSLGGYVSLEMLVRLPHVFGAWAGLQTAIGNWAAERYAEKIARSPTKPMLVLTSTLDHWRSSSEALAAALEARKIAPTLRVIPGPHDQPWLREAGTVEALHWLDRVWPPSAVPG